MIIPIRKKNQYAYKLEGFDEEWQYIGTKRTITFTNLDPKTYTLKVKSSNSAGMWSSFETHLEIVVIPPKYARWWAYCIYTALAIILLYLLYRFQLKRQYEKQEAFRLAELDGVKTKFFTNISHEFRTPLTLIKGLPEMLRSSYEIQNDNKFDKGVDVLERNSSQLLSLVNQLLDLSKLESGTLKLEKEAIDFNQFTKNFVSAYDSAIKMKGLNFSYTCKAEHPIIDGDKKALTHILQNLLGNALKFTANGEIRIRIEVGEANEIYWIISDTGVGIPAAQLPHIFDRFYQVDDTLSRNFEGSGIGLSLTKELTHILGGKIEVKSEMDRGSTFTVSFPLSNDKVVNKSEIIIDKPYIDPTSFDEKTPSIESDKPTVLIVEDNADMRYFITQVLQDDYDVITAEDGEIGYSKASELVPDFIISDWMMPILTGPEMLQKLKTNLATSHIPCMLLTARADQESKLSGYQYGAEAYLTKPFEPAELRMQIKALIDARNAIRKHFNIPDKNAASKPQFDFEKEFLAKINEAVNERLSDSELNGDWLASQLFLSRSQFARKLKAITGISITQFIREQRLLRAKELLCEGRLNVSEIAYETGFSDPAYFSRIFSKEMGISPSDYQAANTK